jgi:hypothetical protein
MIKDRIVTKLLLKAEILLMEMNLITKISNDAGSMSENEHMT